ncbi:STAS domain-containing protein [Geodermatophilus sp. SYSU D00684]
MDEVAQKPRAELTVDVSADGRPLRIGLAGELDLAALPDVQPALNRLLAHDRQPACIDLGALTFLDSTGVAVLVRLANHFAPVEVVRATPAVRRVVQVLGLGARLGLDGT